MVQPLAAQQGESPRALYDQAAKQYQNKNFQSALEQYRQFIAKYSNHSLYWDAKFGVAQSLFKLNKFKEANRQFAAVRKNHPNKNVRGDALFGQIQIAILEDNVAVARALSNKFLDIHTDHMLRSSVKRQLDLMGEMKTEKTKKPSKTSKDSAPVEEPTETAEETSVPDQPKSKPDPPGPGKALPSLRFGGTTSKTSEVQTHNQPDTAGSEGENQRNTTHLRRLSKKIKQQQQTIDQQQNTIKQLKSGLEQQKERAKKFRETNQSLRQNNKRLKKQLSRKLTNIASDTELHEISQSMNLPDTAQNVIESSLDNLRKQSQRAFDQGKLERAKRLAERIIARSPRAADFYRASRIAREMGEHDQALHHIDRAIETSDTVEVKHLAEKADLLLEQGELDQLKQLENEYSSLVSQRESDRSVAHWYHVIGRRYLRQNHPDEAFFHLMQSVRSAPQSRWANRSRRLIQDKL